MSVVTQEEPEHIPDSEELQAYFEQGNYSVIKYWVEHPNMQFKIGDISMIPIEYDDLFFTAFDKTVPYGSEVADELLGEYEDSYHYDQSDPKLQERIQAIRDGISY